MGDVKKEYYFFGKEGRVKITINGGKLTITRIGVASTLSHGFSGEKTILIKNISSVQYRGCGFATNGYLQFVFPRVY